MNNFTLTLSLRFLTPALLDDPVSVILAGLEHTRLPSASAMITEATVCYLRGHSDAQPDDHWRN
jgi:hypothetical protein